MKGERRNYYRPVETSQESDEIMRFIDKEHFAYLGKGVVGMKDSINEHFRKQNPEFTIGERRVRR